MSVQQARRQAEQLVLRLNVLEPPIDVEKLAQELDLIVVKSDLGDDISGLLVTPLDGPPRICVNTKTHEHRQRFSIAHEIGHFFLNHQFTPGQHVHIDRERFVSERGKRSASGTDPIEIEANAFAATLLMPERLVLDRVERIQREHKHAEFSEGLSEDHVERLAREFLVSEQAMTRRLLSLEVL